MSSREYTRPFQSFIPFMNTDEWEADLFSSEFSRSALVLFSIPFSTDHSMLIHSSHRLYFLCPIISSPFLSQEQTVVYYCFFPKVFISPIEHPLFIPWWPDSRVWDNVNVLLSQPAHTPIPFSFISSIHPQFSLHVPPLTPFLPSTYTAFPSPCRVQKHLLVIQVHGTHTGYCSTVRVKERRIKRINQQTPCSLSLFLPRIDPAFFFILFSLFCTRYHRLPKNNKKWLTEKTRSLLPTDRRTKGDQQSCPISSNWGEGGRRGRTENGAHRCCFGLKEQGVCALLVLLSNRSRSIGTGLTIETCSPLTFLWFCRRQMCIVK